MALASFINYRELMKSGAGQGEWPTIVAHTVIFQGARF